jgi:alkanesulfonate monooxygenase SsuD/methylene tetrahydromethanopterin reductase-like flavin-dependent oxidoreductase (luciferase family)
MLAQTGSVHSAVVPTDDGQRKTFGDTRNAFQIGLFGTNCEGGLAVTRAPERWRATWQNNVTAARLAEDADLDFILPIARWHGYRGASNAQGRSFETMAWAAGLLAATERITLFSTLHVPFINPVFAAKQAVTIQAIGGGRYGLNIVAGGNKPEFEMFGIELLEHDARYEYAQEWISTVKRIWGEQAPFDFDGKFFQLKGVELDPKPHSGSRPIILSAGSSGAGRSFALSNADSLFMNIIALETLQSELETLRAGVSQRLRVFASGHVICRATAKEAAEYHRYIVHEQGDWDAVDNILKIRQHQKSIPMDKLVKMKERLIGGIGTWPIIGSPDEVVEQFAALHRAGIDGMALGFVDYIAELPFFRAEVLPRMKRAGLRFGSPAR